ncbi:hypothetical protein JHW43_008638 [Diplocarpon mali]|nr:hypothetical protein JHW43_008638 [Diplocarpon mali]
MASYQGAVSKPRGTKVKPMLRRLTPSEKNSLDLDRPAAEQEGLGILESGFGGSGYSHGYGYAYGGGARSPHDVQMRRGYHHRSTSGTSQFSTTTTGSASGHRAGSFVHPFQQTQTPRPYTPPLNASSPRQDSLRKSEFESPAGIEDDSETIVHHHAFRSPSNLSTTSHSHSHSHSHTSLPSIAALSSPSPNISSQQLQQQLPQHHLRITTTKQASSSRLALAKSHSSLHSSLYNTPLSSEITSSSDIMSPASAIRESLDKGFRIRSRSEVDTHVRAETIREARRKFQEKENMKEEKAAREDIKALEKRQQKEARQINRRYRRSSASDRTRSKRSRSDLTTQEKTDGFLSRGYETAQQQQAPSFGEEELCQPSRSHTAKRKTHSTWTKFVMWIRTRFIRMGQKN